MSDDDAAATDAEDCVLEEELVDDAQSGVPRDVMVNIVDIRAANDRQRSNPCIYRVPLCYRKLNPDAYIPQVVSFGPYHHKCGDHLLPLEAHKERVLDRFLQWKNLDKADLVNAIRGAAPELMGCYDQLEGPWTEEEEFALLMVRDGIFVIALLDACARVKIGAAMTADDNADIVGASNSAGPLGEGQGMICPYNDPVFGKKAMEHMWPYIQRDMILIENQIPLLALRVLLDVAFSSHQITDWKLHSQVMDFLKPQAAKNVRPDWSLRSHFLDIYRESHIKGRHPMSSPYAPYFAGTARALRSRGISIRFGNSDCFDDIRYTVKPCFRLLRLPRFKMDETAECTHLNLLALERLYADTGDEVTTFVFFMARLFRLPSDCRICWVYLRDVVKESYTAVDVVDFFTRLEGGFPPIISERFNEQKLQNWPFGYNWLCILPSVIFGWLKIFLIVKSRVINNIFGFLVAFVTGYLLRSVSKPSKSPASAFPSSTNSTTNG